MARSRTEDLMLTHRFWLMDVVPSATFPFLVLGTPFMGFQSITSPEYTAEMVEIKELNSMYKKYGYGGGSVSPITLTRGVRGYDETMWNWMQTAIRGNDMTNRHLVLLHFTNMAMPVGGDSDLPFDAWETRPFLPGKAWLLWDCLDEDTEILTSKGWRGSDGVKEGDLVYSMNVETEKLETVPVDGYVKRRRAPDDDMVSVAGRRFNFRVTGKHGFYLKPSNGGAMVRHQAADLLSLKGEHLMPVASRMSSEHKGVDLTDDELRFVAWFVTDGHLKEGQRLIISQAKEYRNDIRDLLSRIGLHFTERVIERSVDDGSYANGKPLHEFGVPKGTGGKGLSGWSRYSEYLDKDISELLHDMTRDQFMVFWKELVKGNGFFLNEEDDDWINNSQLWCPSKEQADALVWMATVRGVALSCYERETENGHAMYCLTARDKEWIIVRPGRMAEREKPLIKERVFVDEFVWCVSNRNRSIVTRRGGKVAIMGNCLPTRYKAASDFDATSSSVSISELEIQPQAVTEMTLLDPT